MTIPSRFLMSAIAMVSIAWAAMSARAADWTVAGNILTPSGIVFDGAMAMSDGRITAVGPGPSIPGVSAAVKLPGIILPGFIDLHDHLTWNVLPRWVPGRKFGNRYEWQDAAEYDRVLVAPHGEVMGVAACEAEIYAEVKALAGGSTAVLGGLLKSRDHPENATCVAGLARNLDTDSGLPFAPPAPDDACKTRPETDRTLPDVVDNEIFPMELTHDRMDFLLCELATGTLRGMVIHLSEGTDSSAHREFTMLSKALLLKEGGKEALPREGLAIIHGAALRDPDFVAMKNSKVGLIWSPRSNDELYGSTANIAAAHQAGIDIAIAPDWSPSGSAGMLQEIGYAARRYGSIGSGELIAMATSVAAKIARIDDHVGALAPGKFADFVAINAKLDPNATRPLDAVVRATPADVALVVVGGQPLYGDPALMEKLLPTATLDAMTVCGAPKKVYLGQNGAAPGNRSLDDIKKALSAALAKGGSSLAEIECY
jgi:cytosine/adenosine deaminase-related metal-dependent hydrolase